jgi:arsenate reductase
MVTMKVYTYANCDSCRRAVKWLKAHGLAFEEVAIRETPPTVRELRAMLEAQGGVIRKMFNTSGQEYRAQGLAEKLPLLSATDAVALLSVNGNLVKRPFLITGKMGLVGFHEAEWSAALVGSVS